MARHDITLGSLLRLLVERLDRDVEEAYRRAGLRFRPRYKTIAAMLGEAGEMTIGEIVARTGLAQPSISNTLAAMVKDGIIDIRRGEDRRERLVSLSDAARSQFARLEDQWARTASAAASLDEELGINLEHTISSALEALERKSFLARILEADG